MSVRNSHESYSAVAIALHWAVALLVLGAWLLGQLGDELPRGDPRDLGRLAHISLGLAIIGFVTVRVLWRVADPPPPPEKSPLGVWGEWAGKAVHSLIYALLIAVPIVGIVEQFARGRGLPVFGLFEIASPWTADRGFAHDVGEVHEALANALMALVGLHAAAALVHHYVFRDRTLLRMLPGAR
jgi:cytochrome b561